MEYQEFIKDIYKFYIYCGPSCQGGMPPGWSCESWDTTAMNEGHSNVSFLNKFSDMSNEILQVPVLLNKDDNRIMRTDRLSG